MDYKKPWHALNIDISDAVRKDFNFEQLRENSEQHLQSGNMWNFHDHAIHQVFNQEWMDYMCGIGLPIKNTLIFYREPYYKSPGAHVDVANNGKMCIGGINWVLDPLDNSEMIWYHMTPDPGELLFTPANSKYIQWNDSSIKDHVLDRRCIGLQPTLVSVGIPHNVIVNSRARWAISARLNLPMVDSWQQIVDHCAPFIKE